MFFYKSWPWSSVQTRPVNQETNWSLREATKKMVFFGLVGCTDSGNIPKNTNYFYGFPNTDQGLCWMLRAQARMYDLHPILTRGSVSLQLTFLDKTSERWSHGSQMHAFQILKMRPRKLNAPLHTFLKEEAKEAKCPRFSPKLKLSASKHLRSFGLLRL